MRWLSVTSWNAGEEYSAKEDNGDRESHVAIVDYTLLLVWKVNDGGAIAEHGGKLAV